MSTYQMLQIDKAVVSILKVTNQPEIFKQLLEDLYPCLLQGLTMLESLKVIVCSVESPATVEQILHLLSCFPKIKISELIKKL